MATKFRDRQEHRRKRREALKRAVAEVEATVGGSPARLSVLLAVMRDERRDMWVRVDAARIAARYCHTRADAE
jgi:hypothetical protein